MTHRAHDLLLALLTTALSTALAQTDPVVPQTSATAPSPRDGTTVSGASDSSAAGPEGQSEPATNAAPENAVTRAMPPTAATSSEARNTANSTLSATGSESAQAGAAAKPGAVMGAGPRNVRIGRVLLGSGEPGVDSGAGLEDASEVYNNLYHAPQYMPFFPTAATIWPRVIEVPCTTSGADVVCERYYWRPEYGRGEYLFFTPILQAGAGAAAPTTPRSPPSDR